MKELTLETTDGLKLSVAEIEVTTPKAVIQLIHGAKEYKKRYYGFMEYLANEGFTVIISDVRGHGFSISNEYPLGHMDCAKRLVSDQVTIAKYIKSKYKNTPHYMFGHSMGAMIAKCFIQEYDNKISKMVLTGNPQYQIGITTVSTLINTFLKKDDQYKNKLNDKLSIISNNPLLGAETNWICNNKQIIDEYNKDELCGKAYDDGGLSTLLELNSLSNNKSKYKCNNKDIKILFLAGEEDIITGKKEGLVNSINRILGVGYYDIDYKVYNNMKHEVINEINNEIVYAEIVKFYEQL